MSSAAPTAAVLSLAEAVDRLASPDATERWSPLTGEPLLTVDLSREGASRPPEALAAAAAGLRQIPAPSVALRESDLPPAAEALLGCFDLVVEDAAEVERLRDRVEARPLASLALVQLLRHGEQSDIEAGLVSESLVYSTLQSGPEFAAWLAARKTRPPRTDDGPAVRVWRELDRLHLRLNRPSKRNAFSAEMRDALCEGLSLAVADASIERVIVSGEGPAFCSGGDLDEFGSLPDPATAHAIRTTRNAGRLIAACSRRVHVEVHGACIGAGVELPAFADWVAAREDAFVALPEIEMGLVPGAGGTVSLPRRIGRQRTAWLALSGERIDAERALSWGIFDELLPGRPTPPD